jgi:hypothetical protein
VTWWQSMGEYMLGGPWPMVQVDWVEEMDERR